MKTIAWKWRCARRYMKRADLGLRMAWELASVPSAEDRAEYGPEDWADEDMSCWCD